MPLNGGHPARGRAGGGRASGAKLLQPNPANGAAPGRPRGLQPRKSGNEPKPNGLRPPNEPNPKPGKP